MAFDITKLDFVLPNGWKLVRLGDIADINANTISKKDKIETIKYIDISSVSTHSMQTPKEILFSEAPSRAKRKLKNNDFIISTVRPNLRQFVFLKNVEPNWIASTGFCVVSAKNSKHSWYLYSLVTSERFTEYLSRVANGGAYPAFNPIEIEDAIIPLPNDGDLELINSFAQNINDKIQLNTQTNQTLEAIAQAIFKSWFVDFDPVRAKAAALNEGKSEREANLAAMAIISGKAVGELNENEFQRLWEIAAAFPSELVANEEFGEVPRGWEVRKVGDIVQRLKNSQKLKKEHISNTGKTPVFEQGTSILMGYTDENASQNATIEEPIFIFGDHTCIMHISTVPFSIYQNVIALKGSNLPTYWVYWAVKGKQEFQEYRRHYMEFIIKEIIIPNNEILCQHFSKIISSFHQKIDFLREENRNLTKIRDELLPKLLSGEI